MAEHSFSEYFCKMEEILNKKSLNWQFFYLGNIHIHKIRGYNQNQRTAQTFTQKLAYSQSWQGYFLSNPFCNQII